MKCKAFTMIELIFVIVILGILGSVSITKLEEANRKALAVKSIQQDTEHKDSDTTKWE